MSNRLSIGAVAVLALASASAHAAEPAAPAPSPPATLATYTIPGEAEHGFPPSQAATLIGELQNLLIARGYYAGPADGRMSPVLRTAVSVYQSDAGMRVTGLPDLAVVNMLRFGPDIKATIQPLGGGDKAPPAPAPAPASAATPGIAEPASTPVSVTIIRPAGVPAYEKIAPYRPAAPVSVPFAVAEPAGGEPPLPKAAPQAKVVQSPLPGASK